MCLAIAFLNKKPAKELLMKNVEKVSVNGEKIVLTDILSRTLEIQGTLEMMDLTENIISIQPIEKEL